MNLDSRYLTFLLCCIIPITLIDALNGFMLMQSSGGLPLSSIYKIFLFSIFLLPLLNNPYLFLMLSLGCISISYQIFSGYTLNIFEDVSVVIRTALVVIISTFFINYKSLLRETHLKIIEIIFVISFFIITINVISGLFGYGFTTYGSKPAAGSLGLGYKGYYFAGNELGVLLICLYPVVRLAFGFSNNLRNKLFINLIFITVSVLIGTKTSTIGIAILVLLDLYKYFASSFIKGFILIIVSAVSVITILPRFSDHFNSRIESMSYLLNSRGSNYIILSGRDDFLTNAWNYICEHYGFFDFLLGSGSSFSASVFKSTEMDFFDLFTWNGIFWSVFIYIFCFYLFTKIKTLLITNDHKFFVTVTFILLFFISILAGHVLTSAMLLPFLGLYYPYFYLKNKMEQDNA